MAFPAWALLLVVAAAVAYFLYFEPAAKGLGPARPKFMQELIGKYRYPIFMNVSSLLTILAGLGLYWFSSGGLSAAWLTSGPGLGFTLGANWIDGGAFESFVGGQAILRFAW